MKKLFEIVKYLLIVCNTCKAKSLVPAIALYKKGEIACCGKCHNPLFGFGLKFTAQNTGNGETEMKFNSEKEATTFFQAIDWCKACIFSRKPEGCPVAKAHKEHVGCSDESQSILDGLIPSSGNECSMFVDATQIEELHEKHSKLIARSCDVLYAIETDYPEDSLSSDLYEAVTRARLLLFPGEAKAKPA